MDIKLLGLIDIGSWFSIVWYSFKGWIRLNIDLGSGRFFH
jgi:hypothetical protein